MDLDEIIEIEVVDDLEEAEDDFENARDIRVLVKTDPFTLSDRIFVSMFRLPKELVRYLRNLLNPLLVQPTRRSAISVETKVFVALRFFASGSYQEITGSNHYTGVSQATVSRTEVSTALTSADIFNEWVQFPRNIQQLQLQRLRTRFYEAFEFPGIVGVLDCTHVAISAPHTIDPLFPEHIYVNRKGYHSLNVQIICDERLKVLNVDATFPGSVHDNHIFRQSQVCEIMEQVYRGNPQNPLFLIGDSGYYLRPWLLTPLQNPVTPEEIRFNRSFKTARSLVERCIGVLKNRFRCLLRHRTLHYAPDKAGLITNACIVLHNICIEHNVPEPEEMDEFDLGIFDNFQDDEENNINNRVNPDLAAARELQRRIIENHFA